MELVTPTPPSLSVSDAQSVQAELRVVESIVRDFDRRDYMEFLWFALGLTEGGRQYDLDAMLMVWARRKWERAARCAQPVQAVSRGTGRISRALFVAGLPQDPEEGYCPECACLLRDDEGFKLCPDPDCLSGYIRSGGGWPF